MKKQFNKIKTWLATLWIAIVSFFSKVMGQNRGREVQPMYGVEYNIGRRAIEQINQPTLIDTVIKIAKRPLIGITLIVWIINLIKIRKTEDKTQKKKMIRRTIIVISVLVVLIVACFILPLLLKKY